MKTCKTYNDMKSLDYDKCVLEIYQLNDFDLRTHCDDHYNRLSQVWTKDEMATLEFLEQKYECLLQTGLKKGKDYCKDVGDFQNWSWDELRQCYDDNGLEYKDYIKDDCYNQFPNDTPDIELRKSFDSCTGGDTTYMLEDGRCESKFKWIIEDEYTLEDCMYTI